MITANDSTTADDLGIAASGDAATEGALENDAHIVAAPQGWGRLVCAAMVSNYYL
jgi:hypothetical protein